MALDRRRRILAILLGILLLGSFLQYALISGEDRSAFNRWREQVQTLARGEDAYERFEYPNAPLMGLILYPLSLLPRDSIGGTVFDLGALTWYLLKVAMAALAVVWVVRAVSANGPPFPFWGFVLTLALGLPPILGDLQHGNVNILILFLTIYTVHEYGRGNGARAGIALALAITCKVTPALFLPYLLWKRAWKALAATGAGLVLFFLVVPGVFLGFSRNLELTASWFDTMIVPFAVRGEVTTGAKNQSIPGLVHRLLTDSPSVAADEGKEAEYHNWASLSPSAARWIVKGLGAAFLVLLAWACRAPGRRHGRFILAAECAIVLIGMLLFSERTWKHHAVTLLLPIGVLCYALTARDEWSGGGRRRLLIGLLVAAAVLMTSTSPTLWVVLTGSKRGALLVEIYGAYVWAYLVLLYGVVVVLRMAHEVEAQAPPPAAVSAD
jgi:alpha-1,2-mannosyltransferase